MDSSSIISKKSDNMKKYLILFFLAFTFNHISQEDTTFIQYIRDVLEKKLAL